MTRALRHRPTGGVGELIAASHHEVGEGVARVEEAIGARCWIRARGACPDHGIHFGRDSLGGAESDFRLVSEGVAQGLTESREVMLVNPVDEKGVRNFELDVLGFQPDRLDGFEPSIEGLFAAQTDTNGHENLSPESTRFLQLRGLRGHFSSGPCSEEVSRVPPGVRSAWGAFLRTAGLAVSRVVESWGATYSHVALQR